ncbi:MAG: menaquinone biosynthesis protein, partial [Chlamydiales bacterium]|nr:menaquinone biosynthesis protein [Chlamydiales bacterium]
VSSATFIQNREKYVLLTNLGIGATRTNKSVCLFSNYSLTELDGKTIVITDAHSTSAMLLRVLAKTFWKVAPIFIEVHERADVDTLLKTYDAALVIGDECLTACHTDTIHKFELAAEWYRFTQKPFVFALFATRIDAWMDWPDQVREFHQKLVTAYDYSTANFSEMITSAQSKTGLSVGALQDYYKGLDYYLDSSHFQGLEQFAALHAKCEK